MLEQVDNLGLFVSFPNENEEKPSKAQLKKLAKAKFQQDQKQGKEETKVQGGDADAKK